MKCEKIKICYKPGSKMGSNFFLKVLKVVFSGKMSYQILSNILRKLFFLKEYKKFGGPNYRFFF